MATIGNYSSLKEYNLIKKTSQRIKEKDDLLNKARKPETVNSNYNKTFNEKDIVELVKVLKDHKLKKEDVLETIKFSFLQDQQNMIWFLKIEGALHSLVKLLFSPEPYLQLMACESCCNLSLGNDKTCYQLVKSACPYLINTLKGLNRDLANTSLLTLGNLCASGYKTFKVLQEQGILETFSYTLGIPELRSNTAYALNLLMKNFSSEVSNEYLLIFIRKTIDFYEESENIQWFLYHTSSVTNAVSVLLDYDVSERIINMLHNFKNINVDNVVSVTCLIRTLANLIALSEKAAQIFINSWEIIFPASKRFIESNYRHIRSELKWLFGNLINNIYIKEKLGEKSDDLNWFGHYCI